MRYKTFLIILTYLFFATQLPHSIAWANPNVDCIKRAHAHNDYHHDIPLLEALEHGFKSIEADIFLKDGQLLVGHNKSELHPDRTLEKLYLKPLYNRVESNNGHVYKNKEELLLLIDFKSDGSKTYAVLKQLLTQYKSILTTYEDKKTINRAVKIIITGNRPWKHIISDKTRYVTLDGNVKHLDSDIPASIMPLVSDNWKTHFTWTGKGPMPADQYQLLESIVSKAHKKGIIVRFWATPDKPSPQRTAIWQTLTKAGVDLINTDDLNGLRNFLKHNQQSQQKN